MGDLEVLEAYLAGLSGDEDVWAGPMMLGETEAVLPLEDRFWRVEEAGEALEC